MCSALGSETSLGLPVEIDASVLRVFLTVYRAGSIAAAANELDLPRATISERLAWLERQLGTRLLNRHIAGVHATSRGTDLARRAADLLEAPGLDPKDLTSELAARPLTIGGPAAFLSEVLLPGLCARSCKNLGVVVKAGPESELIAALRRGDLDALVATVPVRGQGLRSEAFYAEEFVLVGRPHWLDRAAQDIERIPVLAYGPELPVLRQYWRSIFAGSPTRVTPRATVPDLRALLRLTIDGAGMSVLPRYLVHEHLESGKLVMLQVPAEAHARTLHLVVRTPGGDRAAAAASGRSGPDAAAAVRSAVPAKHSFLR